MRDDKNLYPNSVTCFLFACILAETEMKREENTLFDLRDLPPATDHHFDGYQNDKSSNASTNRDVGRARSFAHVGK